MMSAPQERSPSHPRDLPEERPELPDEGCLEEEGFPWYSPDKWLSVQIGQVFESRYQVLLKLGFGSVSTVWLCRDLLKHRYVTLKVYETGHRQALNENKVLQHLHDITSTHPGREFVRLALDTFEVPGTTGPHVCIVHEPLSITLKDIRELAGGELPESVLKGLVCQIFLAFDFLHSVAQVVHTDVQEGNIMLSVEDQRLFDELVAEEWENPTPQKTTKGHVVHVSTPAEIPDDPGPAIIADFGDAQFGPGPFIGEVMPDLYRAPEIILCVPWSEKIDIWALGLMIWHMFQGKNLFNKRLPNRHASAGAHLARMISLLGPPPEDLLKAGGTTEDYFDENGAFKLQDLVTDTSLEAEETRLDGEEKAEFLVFIRKMLRWRPADRLSAHELLQDPWVRSLG